MLRTTTRMGKLSVSLFLLSLLLGAVAVEISLSGWTHGVVLLRSWLEGNQVCRVCGRLRLQFWARVRSRLCERCVAVLRLPADEHRCYWRHKCEVQYVLVRRGGRRVLDGGVERSRGASARFCVQLYRVQLWRRSFQDLHPVPADGVCVHTVLQSSSGWDDRHHDGPLAHPV